MINFTSRNSYAKNFSNGIARLCCSFILILAGITATVAQTVTYPTQTGNFYSTYTTGTAGSFNAGSSQIGMYANGGGTKQVVMWRKFRTDASGAGTSDRSMQIGDELIIKLSATRAYGRIGFALLASPSTGSYANRESNYALSVNLDGPTYAGSFANWYVKHNAGATSSASFGGVQGSYKNFTFKLKLTAANRINVSMTDGTATSNFYDLALNTANPITDYSIFLDDDYDGNGNSNAYWGLGGASDQHSLRNTGDLGIGQSNSSFTIATTITNGLDANSASVNSRDNALTKYGTGTVTLTGSNTYTGITTVAEGELRLNPLVNNIINSQIFLNGGTLSTTAIATGISITNSSTLNVNSNSTISLGSNVHSLKFANSSGITWYGNGLIINGWTGTPGTSGTGGKIFFGSGTGTLSPAQLSKVSFAGYTGATLLSTGELVPQGTSSATNISSFSASPNDGNTTSGYAGSTVTLTGAGFIGVTEVKYGGSGGTSVGTFSIVNDNTITFNAPAAMTGNIYVNGSNGSSTSSSSFTNLGYITTASGDYMTSGTWLGGSVPAAGSIVTIAHNVTVSSAANSASTINLNSGSTINYNGGTQTATTVANEGTITFSNTTGGLTVTTLANNGTISWTAASTLNIAANGLLTNNGTFTRGTGTVNFVGVGTVNGTTDVTFNNVTINGGGLSLEAGTTVDGILRINGGNIAPAGASPIYTANSTLFYNTSYGRYLEWSTSGVGTIGTTPGFPNNVTVNAGNLDIANGAGGRGLAGNLTINNGATASISGMNAVFNIGGNLVTNGTGLFDMGNTNAQAVVAGAVTNAGTLTLSTVDDGDLNVKGNLTNSGTFNHNSRTVLLSGSSLQTIGGTTINFHNVTVNNSTAVTLANPITIANNIYLQSGTINTTSSASLTITQTATFGISGGSATSYINGPVRWQLPSNLGSAATYVLPIGKGGNYYPLTLTNPVTGATAPMLTAEAFNTNSGGTADNATITQISNTEYWSLNATGNFNGASVSLERPTAASPFNLIGRSTTAGGVYVSIGGGPSANSIDNSNVTSGAQQFFVFAVNTAAPVVTSALATPTVAGQANSTGYVGQTITINGSSFQNGAMVKFGGIAAASVTYVSSTQLTAVVPANAVSGNISIANPNNISTSTAFTFLGYVTTSAGDFSSASIWLGGNAPAFKKDVTINNAVTVNSGIASLVNKVTVTAGNTLTLGASGALNINGGLVNNGTILMAAGGNLILNGPSNITNTSGTFTSGTGTVTFAGSGISTVTGTISFNKVALQKGVNFGTGSTITNVMEIKAGGYVSTNAPTYASGSTLIYNLSGLYGRFTEWSATTGRGYPHHVMIQGGVSLDLNAGHGIAPSLAGNLTVSTGSSVTMSNMGLPLTVNGNLVNSGTLTLSTNFGGDLNAYGNISNIGTLNTNNRAIFFRGSNIQDVSGTSSLSIPYLRVNKTGGSVRMLSNLLSEGPSTGNAIELANATSILDLNGYTLTIGKAGVTSTYNTGIGTPGGIKGGGNSSIIVLGSGALGSITFDQTTDGSTNVLKDLTINRTSSGTVTLGNKLVLTNVLTPTAGLLNSGGFLHLRSNINGTAQVAQGPTSGGYISGNATVERYIPAFGRRAWRMLSVATAGAQTIKAAWQENQSPMTVGTLGLGTLITAPAGTAAGFDAPSQGSSLLTFNQANPGSWSSVTSTNNAIARTDGYMVFIRGDRSSSPYGGPTAQPATTLRTTGTLYQGDLAPVTSPGGNVNVLMGNLYASAIDFDLLVKSNVTSFKVWDPHLASASGLGAYQSFSSLTGYDPVPGGGSYGSSPNSKIESGQAFIISSGSAGSVQLVEAAKVTGSRNNVFKASGIVKQLKAKLYAISGEAEELVDGNAIVLDDKYSNEVDNDDAAKINNMAENISIVNSGITLLTIEARKNFIETDVVNYQMTNLKKEKYKLELLPVNIENTSLTAYLEDRYLNTTTIVDLSAATSVYFTVTNDAASSAKDRFRILFKSNVAGVKPLVNLKKGKFSVTPNPVSGGRLNVAFTNQKEGSYALRLVNAAGQVFFLKTVNHEGINETKAFSIPSDIAAGVYHLEITNPDKAKKVLSVVVTK